MNEGETVPEERTVRLVLADDHTVVRSALRMLLEAESNLEVVAEAGDADAALRYVRGHRPDVLVLDLNMPGRPSLEILPQLATEAPDTAVVILTMQSEPEFARRALQAGVRGYVLKEAADTELVQAVLAAAAGETYLQPALGARLAREGSDRSREDVLTERELEVLRLIALGHTNAEIADKLGIGLRTVEGHRSHIQSKLDAGTRAELVAAALERDLLAKK